MISHGTAKGVSTRHCLAGRHGSTSLGRTVIDVATAGYPKFGRVLYSAKLAKLGHPSNINSKESPDGNGANERAAIRSSRVFF